MGKADEIANSVGYDSISGFLAMLRHYASDPDYDDLGMFLGSASVIERLMDEVKRLTAEVERLTDKVDDLREEIRNYQEM
jgi:ubiquinone biosynthesis protein UbiJ